MIEVVAVQDANGNETCRLRLTNEHIVVLGKAFRYYLSKQLYQGNGEALTLEEQIAECDNDTAKNVTWPRGKGTENLRKINAVLACVRAQSEFTEELEFKHSEAFDELTMQLRAEAYIEQMYEHADHPGYREVLDETREKPQM